MSTALFERYKTESNGSFFHVHSKGRSKRSADRGSEGRSRSSDRGPEQGVRRLNRRLEDAVLSFYSTFTVPEAPSAVCAVPLSIPIYHAFFLEAHELNKEY